MSKDSSVTTLTGWLIPDDTILETMPSLLAVNSQVGQMVKLNRYLSLMHQRLRQMTSKDVHRPTIEEVANCLSELDILDFACPKFNDKNEVQSSISIPNDQWETILRHLLDVLAKLIEPRFQDAPTMKMKLLKITDRQSIDHMPLITWVHELIGFYERRDNGLGGAPDPLDEFL